ncbi:18247_t:CDS:2, partial [Dentiscutata erythropus]
MSLQNFSNDEYAYLEESQLLPNEEYFYSLSKKSPLSFDKQYPLSLDKDPLLLDDDFSSNKLSIYSKPVSDEEFSESSTNSTQNTITEDILHEAEPQFQFSGKDMVKQKLFES